MNEKAQQDTSPGLYSIKPEPLALCSAVIQPVADQFQKTVKRRNI